MCDARGMSVEAPPPVLPIGDARLERSSAYLCRDAPAVLGLRHRVRRGTIIVDGAPIESWIKTESGVVPKLAAVRTVAIGREGVLNAPGHGAGVFRPPRVA